MKIMGFLKIFQKRFWDLKQSVLNIVTNKVSVTHCKSHKLKEFNDFVNIRPASLILNYHSNILNSSLYRDIQVTEDLLQENIKSNNELVIFLRSLTQNEFLTDNNIPSKIDESMMKNFQEANYTLLDLIEVFYLLLRFPNFFSIFEDQNNFLSMLSEKCLSIERRPFNRTVILMILMTNFHKKYIPYKLLFFLLNHFSKLKKSEILGLFYILKFKIISMATLKKFDIYLHFNDELLKMTMDEFSIIAMGSLGSKIILQPSLIDTMLNKLVMNIENVNDYQACEISKYIAFARDVSNKEPLIELYEKLCPIIDRFNVTTLIHLAYIGQALSVVNQKFLDLIKERIIERDKNIRMNDVKSFLLILLHQTTEVKQHSDFMKHVMEKVLSNKDVIDNFPRSFVCILNCLICLDIYPEDLIDYAFSKTFLDILHTKFPKYKSYELCSIDCSVELERPNYTGNRFPATKRMFFLKYHYFQTNRGFVNNHVMEIKHLLNAIYGDGFTKLLNVLPHFPLLHPVMCFNEDNKPVNCSNLNYVKKRTEIQKFQNGTWIVFYVVTENCFPDGVNLNLFSQTKLRQMRAIGLIPLQMQINTKTWKIKDDDEKINILHNLIKDVLKTKTVGNEVDC